MLRRRPPRRRPLMRRPPPVPRGPRRPSLPPRVRQALVRANGLLADGQFAQAAAAFGRLSERAGQRGMHAPAGDLALQTSRAHFAAGDVDAAIEWAKQGLRLLVRGGRVGRASVVLPKIASTLREKGYGDEAADLEQWATEALAKVGLSFEEAAQRSTEVPRERGDLPARCAGCGAPLVPDEVEWHDAHTAECLFCGALAKTT